MRGKNKLKGRAKQAAKRAEMEGVQVECCPESGKICYDTRREAEHVAKDIQRAHNGRNISVYMCDACGCYHVTRIGYTRSKELRQGKRANKGRLYE